MAVWSHERDSWGAILEALLGRPSWVLGPSRGCRGPSCGPARGVASAVSPACRLCRRSCLRRWSSVAARCGPGSVKDSARLYMPSCIPCSGSHDMYVCMGVWVDGCMYGWMYAWMYICMHVCMDVCIRCVCSPAFTAQASNYTWSKSFRLMSHRTAFCIPCRNGPPDDVHRPLPIMCGRLVAAGLDAPQHRRAR